jgi:D-glycero-alpha-D-manno-heptose-7-phosphate kinase
MKFQALAPTRIDFLGGGSDCPPFSEDFTGAVLNAGINRYVKATVVLNESKGIYLKSKDLKAEVSASDKQSLPDKTELDLLVGCVRRSPLETNFSLVVESDFPPHSGLGASGSVGVAALAVLHYTAGIELTAAELADLAFQVERKDSGFRGGSQDQYAAAFSGFNYLSFHDSEVRVEQLAHNSLAAAQKIKPSVITELEKRLLLIYTGEQHSSPVIHDDIFNSYQQPDSSTKNAMHNLKRLADEGRTVLLDGDLEKFAKLLTENWKWHKELHSSCTNDVLDKIYEVALKNGALGGKTCGAGGGGCVVFLCENNEIETVYRALQSLNKKLKRLNFTFDLHGIKLQTAD